MEKTELYSFDVKFPPKKNVNVDIRLGQAKIELDFEGTAKISLYNGSVLQIRTKGTYKAVTYCTPVEL